MQIKNNDLIFDNGYKICTRIRLNRIIWQLFENGEHIISFDNLQKAIEYVENKNPIVSEEILGEICENTSNCLFCCIRWNCSALNKKY